MIIFSLISELIEENEENEELNEEEKHVKTVEKPFSRSQTKQKDLKKRRQEIIHLHSVWNEFDNQKESRVSHEDPHWRETVHMWSVREEFHTTRTP